MVGCKTTIISARQFSFSSNHLTACLKTEKVEDLSFARFFGLTKGMSAPAFLATFKISLSSEEKIVLVSFLLFFADLIASSTKVFPAIFERFFLLISFDPPLAGITPRIFNFFFKQFL